MTENEIVPSPPGLPQLSNATTTPPTPEEAADSQGEIHCICDYTDDDGFTICCDKCNTWQHLACMQLDEENVPKQYLCSNCSPQPVDAKRAREIQRLRRKTEQQSEQQDRATKAKPENTTRRRRNPTASQRRKEPQTNGTNGNASGKNTQSMEGPTAPRLPSPRGSQAPTGSRKRAQRQSQSNNIPGELSGVIHALSTSCTGDKGVDTETDTESENYKYEFVDISDELDKYVDDGVRSYVLETVSSNEFNKSNEESFKRHTDENFNAEFSLTKASVKPAPDRMSGSYFDHPRWCYVLDSPCSKGQTVSLFKGHIGFQESYKKETINQYKFWNHPKPYVLFHPELPIYIDARSQGTDARFVRRSCKPNLWIRTMLVDDSQVHFGFYATEPLKAGTELTLGWDWNSCEPSRRLIQQGFDVSKLSPDDIVKAGQWVHNLLDRVDCACTGGDDCLLLRIRQCTNFDELTPAKLPVDNGNGKKSKRNQSAEPKDFSPDANDRKSRTGSVSKVKPRSRDLTPSLAQDIAVDSGTMTGREQRKFKDMLYRIEKQAQEEHNPTPAKKRKRNSLESANSSSPVKDSGVVNSVANSPTSTNGDVFMVDASTSRRQSGSSNGSRGRRKSKGSSKSPTASANSSTVSSKVHRKVSKSKTKNYVDTETQTDLKEELPWWKIPRDQAPPPRPPRVTLRQHLLQSMHRDREQSAAAAKTAQDKKRKFDEVCDDTPVESSPTKLPKLPEVPEVPKNEPVEPVSSVKVEVQTSAVLVSCGNQMDIDADVMEGNIVKIIADPSPVIGPTLGELFADAEKFEESSEKVKQTNGIKPPELQLQLPPSSDIPNGPNSASSQTTATPGTGVNHSPTTLSATATILSPSVITSLGSTSSVSSPVKTKKLTLKDYGKRKAHKATDSPCLEKKCDEKPQPMESSPINKPVSLQDQGKIAEMLTTEAALTQPPSQQTSALEANKISLQQRVASTYGVR